MLNQTLTTEMKSLLIKILVSALLLSALSDCSSTKDRFSKLKNISQSSIYNARDYRDSYLRLDRNLVNQDSQLKYRSELDNNPFGQHTWSRNCDCH